jgi:hypothetical protein
VSFAGCFLVVSALYLVHSVDPESPMTWAAGGTPVRVMLLLATTGLGLALLLVVSTVLAWREAGPALPAKVHLALVGVAAVTLVVWWQRLGLLLP